MHCGQKYYSELPMRNLESLKLIDIALENLLEKRATRLPIKYEKSFLQSQKTDVKSSENMKEDARLLRKRDGTFSCFEENHKKLLDALPVSDRYFIVYEDFKKSYRGFRSTLEQKRETLYQGALL